MLLWTGGLSMNKGGCAVPASPDTICIDSLHFASYLSRHFSPHLP
jgi:hypothetical protein